MRRWLILIFRWIFPVLFIYLAIINFLMYPVTFVISIALASFIFPPTQQFIYKKTHLPSTIWTKSLIVGILFVLFSITYPKPLPRTPQSLPAQSAQPVDVSHSDHVASSAGKITATQASEKK